MSFTLDDLMIKIDAGATCDHCEKYIEITSYPSFEEASDFDELMECFHAEHSLEEDCDHTTCKENGGKMDGEPCQFLEENDEEEDEEEEIENES